MTAPGVNYFAYGSNLSPARLIARVGECLALGCGALAGYELRFDKPGRDWSGKANVRHAVDARRVVYGAVYRLDEQQFETLHRFERGYSLHEVVIDLAGVHLACTTYMHMDAVQATVSAGELAPYSWYLDHMVSGARHHGLPDAYRHELAQTPSIVDPDAARDALERS